MFLPIQAVNIFQAACVHGVNPGPKPKARRKICLIFWYMQLRLVMAKCVCVCVYIYIYIYRQQVKALVANATCNKGLFDSDSKLSNEWYYCFM